MDPPDLTDDQIRDLRAGAWLRLAAARDDATVERAASLAWACEAALGPLPDPVRRLARTICALAMREYDASQ